MNHLTPDEVVDAVEDMLTADRLAHVRRCVVCREEVAQLSGVLTDARGVSASEPSPLFWEHLSARVRHAITTEPAPHGRLPQWLQWQVLAPLAGMAFVLVALGSAVTADPFRYSAGSLSAPRMSPAAAEAEALRAADSGWAAVMDLVGPIDFETAQEAGLGTQQGAAEQAVLQLSVGEQEELVRLLEQELNRAGG